jgi:cytochrome c oxidase cbb3-type subunit III
MVAAMLLAVGVALAQEGDPGRGATIFANNCAVCHGADGKGRIGANLTQDFPAINVDAFLRQTITTGVKGSKMPAWGDANGGPLSAQDIADVASYVQALEGGSAPAAPAPTIPPVTVAAPPNVSGNASVGAQVFAQNCAVCHGDQGQGRVGATLAKQWPSIEPARYVQQTVENGVAGSVMPAWLNSNGGPLNQDDINNVTAYVLSLQPAAAATAAPAQGGGLTLTTTLIGLAVLVLLGVIVLVMYYRRAQ